MEKDALQPIETLALDKAANGTAKPARKAVNPGSHAVDFLVRVRGTVNVGNDYESAPTASIPMKRALAALAAVSGCTGKAGIAKIRQAMELALTNDADAGKILTDMLPQIERGIYEHILATDEPGKYVRH
ncbi:hypothetical protein LCGC14_2784690 [marine sediment metagenome]|uniref:Uncharacterized protein n=1 Tax=marine sediment metagenome TaxID=412755 RepID=A0A0F9BIQ8_9ZZZZ